MALNDRAPPRRGPQGDVAELRGDCPRQTLQVLDAVAIARDLTRIALVNEILGEWAAKKLHESMLIQRVTGANPQEVEAVGGTFVPPRRLG